VRNEVLPHVARAVPQGGSSYVGVGIGGPDRSGKTWFADELAGELNGLGRAVVRASIDDFHQVRGLRYRRGPRSPEGFYRWLRLPP